MASLGGRVDSVEGLVFGCGVLLPCLEAEASAIYAADADVEPAPGVGALVLERSRDSDLRVRDAGLRVAGGLLLGLGNSEYAAGGCGVVDIVSKVSVSIPLVSRRYSKYCTELYSECVQAVVPGERPMKTMMASTERG